MKQQEISITGSDFANLFPFHVSIGKDSRITSFGNSLHKAISLQAGDLLSDHFYLYRPQLDSFDYSSLKGELNSLCIIETRKDPKLKIRGQWIQPQGKDGLVFAGSPWIDNLESMVAHGLKITDFAVHDPLMDLLHIIKTNEIGMNDLKDILGRFQKQKNELNKLSVIATETVNSIVTTDAKGDITWVNKSFEKMTGYSLEEVIGRKPGSFLQGDNTDKETVLYMSRQIREGKPFNCEVLNYDKEKKPYWVRILGQPLFDKQGQVEQYFAIEEDITEQKESMLKLVWSEQKYRGIIENMDLGLVEFDTEENVSLCNQSFCKITGYEEKELVGKSLSDLLHERNANFESSMGLRKRHRGISEVYEVEITDKSGNEKWMLVSKALLFDTQKRITGSIGIFLDISWRKKLELEVKNAREQAIETSKAKENFLVNMSHEIRTPMNVILGMSRHLGGVIKEEKQLRFLNSITSAAENLLVIINDVLDISKIESGKMEIEKIGFHPRMLLNECSQLLGFKAEEKGLILSTDIDKDVPEILVGDRHRLHQILMNIAGNAIKFTDQGSVDISAYVDSVNGDEVSVKIVVEDTGIGIDSDKLEEVFESFRQESNSISRQYGGTGLGLTISRELARLMGGELRIDSQKGTGTRVVLELPFKIGTKSDVDDAAGISFDPHQLKSKRILVVEDNSMNLALAETVLQSYGAIVRTAISGNEAIDLAGKESFDVILMDLRMPGMDGLEATRRLRQTYDIQTPIIALTANTRSEVKSSLQESGVSEYLLKPYRESALIGKIVHVLGMEKKSIQNTKPVIEVASSRLYNTEKLEAFTVKNPDFLRRMLQLFIEESISGFKEMKDSLDRGDLVRVGDLAHRMKPGMDQLMAEDLLAGVKRIEQLAKKGDTDNSLPPLVDEMEQLLGKVIEQIKENEF